MRISSSLIPSIVISLLVMGKRTVAQDAQAWTGTCQITFSGKSTLHPFSGTVNAEPFSVSITNPSDPTKATARSRVLARASKLNTGNTKRDKKMHQVLAVNSFTDIIVDIGTLTAAATKPGTGGKVLQPTIVPFSLTIRDQTKKIVGQVSDWIYADNKISFRVKFPISLTAFGIKPPSVVGIIKVDDTILIGADLILMRKEMQ